MMTIKNILCLSLTYAVSNSAVACINSYAFEMGASAITQEYAEEKLEETKAKIKTVEELNDYGVLLIFAHRYNDAIKMFKQLEKQHPNLAKTAANLGTAYELSGDLEKAKYWIAQGMQRDANIHQGSEWIHLKILDAQIQQKKDSKWIQTHDVLGLDFGTSTVPKAKVQEIVFQNKHYDLDKILLDSEIQMDQRLRFVKHDPISAQIVFNMANIELTKYNTDDYTVDILYDRAKDLGYSNPQLLEKRKDYFLHSKWFQFKAFVFQLWQHLKKFFD